MHLLSLPARLDLGQGNVIVPGEYLIDDLNAANLLVMAGGGKMTPLTAARGFGANGSRGTEYDWAGCKILLMRAGGYGDLVLLTPVLREIKRRWPTAHVAVCTMVNYGAVLANLPFVDEIVPYPITKAKADEFDAWVFYENAIENNPRAEVLHMTQVFAEIAGLGADGVTDLHPAYAVKPSEAIWCNEAFPRVNGTRRVCIQIGASAIARVYPQQLMGAAIGLMVQRGWEVFLLGSKGEIKLPDNAPPLLRNLSEQGLTFRQSAAVVNTCDCFVGNDSALLHVAGALDVPGVGLYGPFPRKLRTAYSPSIHSLQGVPVSDVCPCFHHVNAAIHNHFPEKCPTKAQGICGTLAEIKPERIVSTVDKIMRRLPPIGDVVAVARD